MSEITNFDNSEVINGDKLEQLCKDKEDFICVFTEKTSDIKRYFKTWKKTKIKLFEVLLKQSKLNVSDVVDYTFIVNDRNLFENESELQLPVVCVYKKGSIHSIFELKEVFTEFNNYKNS